MPFSPDSTSTETKPAPSAILKFFAWTHLPERLQDASKSFAVLAQELEAKLPPGPEKSTALRKLLEAKDCALRAML